MTHDAEAQMYSALRELVEKYPIHMLKDHTLAIALRDYRAQLVSSNPFAGNRLPDEIILLILDNLSVPDVISFTQVCRSTRRFRQPQIIQRLNKLIAPYADPSRLLKAMREAPAVIGGSSALWFLEGFPTHWTPKDLNLYCPNDSEGLVEFLVTEGYTITSTYFVDDDDDNAQTTCLASTTYLERNGRKVDVRQSSQDEIVEPIMCSGLSVVMNYISADFIVSLYPQTTFRGISVAQTTLAYMTNEWNQLYIDRGYTLTEHSRLGKYQALFCRALDRLPGDVHSFVVPYGQSSNMEYFTQNTAEILSREHDLCNRPPARCILHYVDTLMEDYAALLDAYEPEPSSRKDRLALEGKTSIKGLLYRMREIMEPSSR